MASGDEKERPAAGDRGGVPRKSRRSILDKNGRYIPPKRGRKPRYPGVPVDLPPKTKETEDMDVRRSGVRLIKKKKTKAEKAAAKKLHAIKQEEILMYARRRRILAMREQGATIEQISEQLKASGEKGCSPASVQKHLVRALDDILKEYMLEAKHYAQLRLNQMQRVELSHLRRLCDTALTPDEFEKLSRGMDRIWKRMDTMIEKLTGEPKTASKIEITTDTPMPIETTVRVIMPSVPETDPAEGGEEEGEEDAA